MNNSKIIVITGASSGIGKATALYLLEKGHKVYGLARRVDKMGDIIKKGGVAKEMDVIKHQQVKEVISSIIKTEGRIDVLINNAGYSIYGPIEDTSYEMAKQQFEVNLFGLVEVTKAVLPIMRKQKAGIIFNMSSMGGKIYMPLMGWYGATKWALEGWSDVLRLEVKQFGIKVVIIEPGMVKSELAENTLLHAAESKNSAYSELKKTILAGLVNTFNPDASSDPIVVAKVIEKAMDSADPETRYPVGNMAKENIETRASMSDKAYDALVMEQLQTAANL
ncbi:oxidoreductase [Maribacter arenosus]|uniref:SDR family NAD(P)-dependent oxidoreductase n=1 Tax=Maribacter arenosus TaxID=1854708 RepID=A0ABR7VDK5_9FLAO|nr:oxidoreductase [Maribacter arenosus]MBD0851421.1 SDR family NAD(P)-dependent oxidoreductase [Maribacter arenosus]